MAVVREARCSKPRLPRFPLLDGYASPKPGGSEDPPVPSIYSFFELFFFVCIFLSYLLCVPALEFFLAGGGGEAYYDENCRTELPF